MNYSQKLSTNKKPLESKKWIAMIVGICCVMFVYLTALITIIYTGGQGASEIVTLANIVVIFIGAMNTTLITGQSAIDWRQSGMINTSLIDQDINHEKKIQIQETKFSEKVEKTIDIEGRGKDYEDDENENTL